MDNPEIQATLSTWCTMKTNKKLKTQHRKLKRWATQTPPGLSSFDRHLKIKSPILKFYNKL
jgi:hypothetical protein